MDTTASPTNEALRELDARNSNGIQVALLWEPNTDRVHVDVFDARTLEHVRFPVLPEHALDAFHHPFAYASAHGVQRTSLDEIADLRPV